MGWLALSAKFGQKFKNYTQARNLKRIDNRDTVPRRDTCFMKGEANEEKVNNGRQGE